MNDTTSLYRIIPFEGFMSLLVNNTERFVNPLSWDDTYEGCGLRYAHEDDNVFKLINTLWEQYKNEEKKELIVLHNFTKAECVRDYSFCQCWSLNRDSDAMWRIYNYNNHAIQIESNRIALQTHLKMSAPDGTTYVCRIKKVKYDVDNKDKEESYVRFYQKGMDFTESFFHKRAAFAHEDEVRVLLHHRDLGTVHRRAQNHYRKKLLELNPTDTITVDDLTKTINDVHSEQVEKYNELRKSVGLDVIDMAKYILGVKVHPQAEEWYVNLVGKICSQFGLSFNGKSDLYGNA